MANASFASLDIGLPGGDRYPTLAQASIVCVEGPLQILRTQYSFPGFDGLFSHNAGARGRTVTWQLTICCASEAEKNAIETEMDAAAQTGGGELVTTTGRTYARAILKAARRVAGWQRIRGGERDGWVIADYVLEFEVLSAD